MTKIRKALGLTAGALTLAAVPALGLTAVAGATTGETTDGARRGPRPQLTDEQQQCLADQGVTRPERSADGTRVRPTDEQRAAFEAAAAACGLPAPGAGVPSARPGLGS